MDGNGPFEDMFPIKNGEIIYFSVSAGTSTCLGEFKNSQVKPSLSAGKKHRAPRIVSRA